MKRLIVIALIAMFGINCFSQNSNDTKNEAKQKKENTYYNRIMNEKIAFFTSEIDLTPEEAQLFWPVYNKFWKDSQTAHRATMKVFHKMKNIDKDNLSDKEVEQLLKAYIKAQDAERAVNTDYYSAFTKVLPIAKVAKMYVAEEFFRMKMINDLRKQQKPAKQDISKAKATDDNKQESPCVSDSDCAAKVQ